MFNCAPADWNTANILSAGSPYYAMIAEQNSRFVAAVHLPHMIIRVRIFPAHVSFSLPKIVHKLLSTITVPVLIYALRIRCVANRVIIATCLIWLDASPDHDVTNFFSTYIDIQFVLWNWDNYLFVPSRELRSKATAIAKLVRLNFSASIRSYSIQRLMYNELEMILFYGNYFDRSTI